MAIFMTFIIAVRALRRNAMRTMLTALGMIIGVAAVIVMMALGSGARNAIETQIRNVGSNLVTVNAGSQRFGTVRGGQGGSSTLTVADALAIRENVAGVKHLTPGLNIRVQAISSIGNWSTSAQGSNEELPDIRSWPAMQGSFFGEDDVRRATKVAVLGSVARDQLFGAGNDPVGQMIRIRNQPFRVVGVLAKKGQASFGGDQDDTIIVPYTTVQKRLTGQDFLREITIQAETGVDLQEMVAQIQALLRERHNIPPGGDDDFLVRTLDEMAGVLTQTTNTMTYLLAGIAAVSLLVGGIGIMNIMLVSVTERTREIGLRLSVGARDLDVLLQFLTEAMVLSLAGGAIGVALGYAASKMMTRIMQWSTLVTLDAVALSFGCAAAIGIFFGFYPARKAAGLDPIDALRYE
ncbi:MAG TPA: ABC transporter permease [Vicinamibacterales bacterium]|nr:ABC transporter permease [Vicinamibacterales bacterium]